MRQLKITKQVTNRDTPSLDKYLQEIGKVDLISPEEEVVLRLARQKSGRSVHTWKQNRPGYAGDRYIHPYW